MTRVLGIDPGTSGALALWDNDLNALRVLDMPTLVIKVGKASRHVLDEQALAGWIRSADPDHAFCEHVHSMPRDGTVGAFKFGVSYGTIRGVLAALSVPTTFVAPLVWQRQMRVAKGKDAARQRITQLLPGYAALFCRVKDHGRADAALIALANANV